MLEDCEVNDEVDCTTCRLCTDKCPAGIELDKLLPVLRVLVTPKGSHRGVFQTIGKLLTNSDMQPFLKENESQSQ